MGLQGERNYRGSGDGRRGELQGERSLGMGLQGEGNYRGRGITGREKLQGKGSWSGGGESGNE